MPSLYLVGMMGSGKSVTGKRLAALLGLPFFDLDERIEEKAGRGILQIFEKDGEANFRNLETAVLKEVPSTGSKVIATGGGIVLGRENVEWMRRTGKIIYLKTSLAELWGRLQGKKNRPLLKGTNPRANLERILKEREGLYEKVCDLWVDTDGCTADQTVQKILETLRPLT